MSRAVAEEAAGGTPRGLVNLGNTCFLNSAVQALAACAPLATAFDAAAPLLHLPSTSKKGAELTGSFSRLLKDLRPARGAERSALRPSDLVDLARGLTPALEGYGQQDVEEFLNALLDSMHEHLRRPLCEQVRAREKPSYVA